MASDSEHSPGNLHWKILTAVLLAFLGGLAVNLYGGGATDTPAGWAAVLTDTSGFLGKLFLQGLKMIVIPLVVSSIIVASMNIGGERDFFRLGGKTMAFYLLSGLAAVVVGLLAVNLIQPGAVDEDVREKIFATADSGAEELVDKAEGRSSGDLIEIFLRMIPTNIIDAAAGNEFLGLIFFSLLFGYAAGKLPDAQRKTQQLFWEGLNAAITRITNGVIWFAPVGVFGLVLPTIASSGPELISNMLVFAVTVFLALGIHVFVTMPLILALVARVNPLDHYRAMLPALLTAFSTASSASTLPVTTGCVRRIGVSDRVSGFTLPLGATINMDGTALFECVVVIFLMQLFGVEISLLTQFNVVILALLTSVGVAGIPSASLVAIVLILTNVGFTPEMIATGVGVVFAVDRILDMARTAVNIFGDSCAAVVIGRSEGEEGYYSGNAGE